MASSEGNTTALANRSLRAVKAELEFLAETSIISAQQLSSILSQLPIPTAVESRGPVSSAPAAERISSSLSGLNINSNSAPERQQQQPANGYYPSSSPAPFASPVPPPAYASAHHSDLPVLARAEAIYQYTATDPGDLAIYPNDRITVTEYTNPEWWKGRNERTGQEGIFPRSYVRPYDKVPPPPQPQPSNYGNMPLDVAQGAGAQTAMVPSGGAVPSKGAEYGKRFGKKLGNAAIFGAGATMGADLVNSIL